jgi:sigma-B regulation protein RsbU (phosphoserine phosphatase)
MTRVLLSSMLHSDSESIRESLAAAGFTVVPHGLGAAPTVDFTSLAAAVIDAGERTDLAAAQTRRWRLELGDHIVPVLWLLADPADANSGFAAGADACLERTSDTLAAQVKAMARMQATAARLGRKAAESLLLGEQLRKARVQLDLGQEMGRRIRRGSLPQSLPEAGDIRLHIVHRPQAAHGGDFYDVRRLDEHTVGFFLGDALGRASAGNLLGVLVNQAVRLKIIYGHRYRLVPPDEAMLEVNRTLLGLNLEEPPLVALLIGTVDARDGSLSLARAGFPAPVFIPANGPPEVWSVPGPFLGAAETTYPPRRGTLQPGDKLLLASDGASPPGEASDPLLESVTRHRHLNGVAFTDAVAAELLPRSHHPDDFTLLLVERMTPD